uniref:NIF3-like protein 1 n=1 Tax=Pseudodiaptomus poplesia TaxID=213370 RepID=A0A0U2V781_9MAXI|nr:NIF3-like protein 1 [Pseudodiaptomus poplesia]
MDLKQVVKKLEEFAPSSLAGSWDNVGLLLEPTGTKVINKIFVTNDLTEPVLREAVDANSDMILSYHPPIFRPMKRLTLKQWKERVIIEMLERRMALYSPHTAWDAVQGGINDWLLLPFGKGASKPAQQVSGDKPAGVGYSVSFSSTALKSGSLLELLSIATSVTMDDSTVNLDCSEDDIPKLMEKPPETLKGLAKITKHETSPPPVTGPGRILKLEEPLSLGEVVERTKKHLGLTHVRLALANGVNSDSTVKSIAVCAGSEQVSSAVHL